MSHPRVSHQVETNVVTQAERPTCDIAGIRPCGPTSGDRRRPSQFSPRTRFPRLGPPHCRTDRRRERPCACYSRLNGRVPTTRQRPRDLPSSSRDRNRRARRPGHGQMCGSASARTLKTGLARRYRKYSPNPAESVNLLLQISIARFEGLLALLSLPFGRTAYGRSCDLNSGLRATRDTRPAPGSRPHPRRC